MQQPNWERIQEIYHSALALTGSERDAFVVKACAGDPVLIREVKSLLDAHESSGDFLEAPVFKLDFVPKDLVGTTIGERYVVEKELGHGAMGQVYFAHDGRLNHRPVVIKVLSQALLDDSDPQQRFRQEVEALSRIHHPNVVEVLDTGELRDGRPYIVMQYVDGEMLRLQIPNEGMDLERAASILKQLGAALDHVHEKGIFHRDLKPENIIVKRGTDSIVLVDFGIAKVQDSIIARTTALGSAPGTLVYMSPEQLGGETITAASDVYSMAVIAYELVTGRRPFKPNTASQLIDMQRARVRVKPVDLRQDLASKAQDVILRGLSFNPNARYENAKEFGDKLGRALLEPRVPPDGTRWRRVVAACLSILVGVALLSFGIYKYSSAPPETGPIRSFRYWLEVQRTRDGKDYGEPFKSNGDEQIFHSGYKFRLNVESGAAGYLYVINEGASGPNNASFRMIYPNSTTNNGIATLSANQPVQSEWMVFRGPPGAENIWIVWSTSLVSELESAKIEAFKHPNGALTGNTLLTVREYLKAKQSEIKAKIIRYKATDDVLVRGASDILVTLAQFEHR